MADEQFVQALESRSGDADIFNIEFEVRRSLSQMSMDRLRQITQTESELAVLIQEVADDVQSRAPEDITDEDILRIVQDKLPRLIEERAEQELYKQDAFANAETDPELKEKKKGALAKIRDFLGRHKWKIAIGLVAAGLAWYFWDAIASFIPGLGGGIGEGAAGVEGAAEGAAAAVTEFIAPEKVVNVLIDGDVLKIANSEALIGDQFLQAGNYTESTLEKVMEFAKQVEGDSGIKIQLFRTRDATAGIEGRLMEAVRSTFGDDTPLQFAEDILP